MHAVFVRTASRHTRRSYLRFLPKTEQRHVHHASQNGWLIPVRYQLPHMIARTDDIFAVFVGHTKGGDIETATNGFRNSGW